MIRVPNWIKQFDSFPKLDIDFVQKTESGGILSLVIMLIMGYLLLSEVIHWRTIQNKYEFLVDQSHATNSIDMNIDITVAMDCKYVRLDVLDAAQNTITVPTAVKTPVSYHTLGALDLTLHLNEDMNKIHHRPQSGTHRDYSEYKGSLNACKISGSFQVMKVEGSVHVTANGHGYAGVHAPHDAINFTHRIDEFSFGKRYPGLINPLDYTHLKAQTRIHDFTIDFDNFQYFLGIVPTIYVDDTALFGGVIITNQYAVTEFNHAVDPNNPDAVPGIFFKYAIEPLSVRITQFRVGFTQFITRTCGIVGGVFVTAGVAFRLLNFLQSLITK